MCKNSHYKVRSDIQVWWFLINTDGTEVNIFENFIKEIFLFDCITKNSKAFYFRKSLNISSSVVAWMLL